MNRLISTRRIFQALAVLLAIIVPASGIAAEEETEIGYYALKPSFVSNLTGGPKYIRCDIQLMTEQASQIPEIELHTPALRHGILMLIGGQDGNHLQTRNGKEDLRLAALESVRNRLEQMTGKPIVDDLYFTAYYVK